MYEGENDLKLQEKLKEQILLHLDEIISNPTILTGLYDLFKEGNREIKANPIIPIHKLFQVHPTKRVKMEVEVPPEIYKILRDTEKTYKIPADMVVTRVLQLFFRI